jgi:hypothetical protein
LLFFISIKNITYFDDSGILCDEVAQNSLASFWVAANRPASFFGTLCDFGTTSARQNHACINLGGRRQASQLNTTE